MKNIFTKRIARTASIVGISGIALLLIGIATYASVPSFQNFVKSSLGIEKKNVSVPVDANNKTVTEENNASDTSQNTITAEKPTENIATDNVVTTEKVPATTSTPKTKTPAPASTPVPIPTPTSTPPPTQVTFQVSSVTASVSPTASPCNNQTSFWFAFTGTITVTAAGTVQYKWVQDDGGGSTGTLTFSSAGSQQLTTDRPIYGSKIYAGWNKIVVTSPNSISSNQVSFTRLWCP